MTSYPLWEQVAVIEIGQKLDSYVYLSIDIGRMNGKSRPWEDDELRT